MVRDYLDLTILRETLVSDYTQTATRQKGIMRCLTVWNSGMPSQRGQRDVWMLFPTASSSEAHRSCERVNETKQYGENLFTS